MLFSSTGDKYSPVVCQDLHLFGRFGDCFAVSRLCNNRRGYLSRDVRLSIPLLVVNPKYDMRKVGFETIKRMQKFGMQNAVSHVDGQRHVRWATRGASRVVALTARKGCGVGGFPFQILVLLQSPRGRCRR